MIVAIPVYEKSTKSRIHPDVYAPYYVLYETGTGETQVVENTYWRVGDPTLVAAFLQGKGVSMVITNTYREGVAYLLEQYGIKIAYTPAVTAKDAIQEIREGKIAASEPKYSFSGEPVSETTTPTPIRSGKYVPSPATSIPSKIPSVPQPPSLGSAPTSLPPPGSPLSAPRKVPSVLPPAPPAVPFRGSWCGAGLGLMRGWRRMERYGGRGLGLGPCGAGLRWQRRHGRRRRW